MDEKNKETQGVTKRFSWEDLDELATHYAKQMTPDALGYLASRGIEEKTVELFRIGFETPKIGFHAGKGMLGGYFSNCIIFPVVDVHGKVVDLVGRTIDDREPKYRSLLGRGDTFFNHPVIAVAEDIILVRNVFDVLSLAQVQLPAVSLPDMSVFKEHHAQELKGKRVFVCYPNDDSGRRESLRIAALLEGVATEVYMVHLPEGVRDVNDLFLRAKQPMELFMSLLNDAVSENLKLPLFPDARSLTVFTEEYAKRQKGVLHGIPTGFAALDEKLAGGLRAGLYLLAGSVSSGKSMLLRQISDQIAKTGTPVVYVSWEMTGYELWCRSIARLLQVPPQDVLAGKVELDKISAATQAYAEIAKHMWTIEGTFQTTLDDIEEMISRIIQSVGKAPVIVIDDLFRTAIRDHNGNLVHNNEPMAAFMLHQWSRKWSTPVVMTVPQRTADAVQLHALVEAAVDTIFHLQTESDPSCAAKQMETVSLTLLKNRNGALGSVKLCFHKEKAEFSSSHP